MFYNHHNFSTTTNLWLECVDYYNRGLTFKEITECIHNKFMRFGMPEGASTSIVIDLYCNPDYDQIREISWDMYHELNNLCRRKERELEDKKNKE